MQRKTVWGVALMAVMLALPAGMSAQVASWKDVQVKDIEGMKDKFVALAGAFDESHYAWRPMEGVRSVGEVLGLAVAEANLFPGAWGADPGPTAVGGFGAELAAKGALSQADMIADLNASFDYLVSVVQGMDNAKRMSDSSYFGNEMPTHANIATAMADMHEHLGQLIAYARMNHVVPPWSMGN